VQPALNQTGTVDGKPSSGKMRKMQTAGNIDSVEKLVLRQENALGWGRIF